MDNVDARLWFIADVCHKYPAACASCISQICIKMFKFYLVVTVFNAVSDAQEKLGCFEWQAETENPPWIEPCARHAYIHV